MLGQVVTHPWWAFVILGLFAGLDRGGLGLGGGVVLVPTLVLLAGFSQKSAQGMALTVMVPLALVGAWRYWRHETVDVNLAVVCLIAVGSLVGTLIGAELAIRLPGHVLRKVFAVCLILVAARMLIGSDPTAPAKSGNVDSKNVQDQTGSQ